MLRQHHVRLQDLQPFLRGYDPSKPTAPDDWAKVESARYEPGMLIFFLDAVATPPGLSQFGKKEMDLGESFRVKDLSIVIGRENGKPLVVKMTASAYEQRFLEVLLLENARRAILDGKDFLYVAAAPAQKLSEPTAKELEQLGAMYAQGGSRRSLAVEGGGGPLEPAVALLGSLGVRFMQQTGGGRTVLEIGSVCQMIFAPDMKMDDKNKMLMKACFTPIPSSPAVEAPPEPQTVQVPPDLMSATISLPDPATFSPEGEVANTATTFEANYKPENYVAEPDAQHFSFEPSTSVGAVDEPWLPGANPTPGLGFDQAQVQPSLPLIDPSNPAVPDPGPQSTSPAILYNKLNEQIEGTQPLNQFSKRTGEIPIFAELSEPSEIRAERNTTADQLPAVPENGELLSQPNFGKLDQPPASSGPLAEAFKARKSRTNMPAAGSIIDPPAPGAGDDQYRSLAEAISGITAQPPAPPAAPDVLSPSQALEAFGQPPAAAPPLAMPTPPPPNPSPSERVRPARRTPRAAEHTLIDLASPLNVDISAPDEILSPEVPPAPAITPEPEPMPLPAFPEPEPVAAPPVVFDPPAPPPPPPAPVVNTPVVPPSVPLNAFEMLAPQPMTPAPPSLPEPVVPAPVPFEPPPPPPAPAAFEPLPLPAPVAFEPPPPPPAIVTPEAEPIASKFSTHESEVAPLPPAPPEEAKPAPTVRPRRNTFTDLIPQQGPDTKLSPEPVEAMHVSQAPTGTGDSLTPVPVPASTSTSGTRRSVEFQEPKLVLNEMASLMSKLELQVSKASKRLASRAEEIEHRLTKQLEGLMEEAAQEDKDVEASMLVLCDTLGKEFEQASESLRQKISNVASEGRQNIKQLVTKSQSDVDERKDSIHQELESACSEFRVDTERLIRESKTKLNKLLQDSIDEMADVLKTILDRLDDSTSDQTDKLKDRFERFRERMAEETRSVLGTVERNVRSMGEEIDGSWQRASEKLRLSQSDFEQTVLHAVRVAELALSQSARTLLVDQFFPKLKERKEIVTNMVAEMTNTFSEQSLNQARGQLMGLEASLASARQQLQTLADECLTKIDSVGRDQQSVLEELFKDTSGYIERSTSEVLALLKKAEDQILESEAVCKKLAETFSLDADPTLSDERNTSVAAVQALRTQLKQELESAAQSSCHKLDELAQGAQQQLNAKRLGQIQIVRDSSENGLNEIREAIQEAFNAIQASREKHME
jgi:hypothetical protein